ncbi:hypothetical protein PsorP6_014819 [Peronosclerospora sorghi]|uniref:Uncharacterized protein n=1 Tax=Peronosclerospora sorghi TaxID=230839 RepID=A0ACC0VT34_9STRA|nr:hypothetical protein PsorP6_014819 [Peronosclerospora sorghi]
MYVFDRSTTETKHQLADVRVVTGSVFFLYRSHGIGGGGHESNRRYNAGSYCLREKKWDCVSSSIKVVKLFQWDECTFHLNCLGKTRSLFQISFSTFGSIPSQIFSLATLLCSKLIYNSQGSVDEKAIHGLRFIANLAKHIKVSASAIESEDEDVMQFHSFFPSFLWVVRDYTLELVDEDGNPISSSEYLERALSDQPRTPTNIECNRIGAMMKDLFPMLDCTRR